MVGLGGGRWWRRVNSRVASLVLPGVCSHPKSPKQQPTVLITAREAPAMTIRHHLKTLQLPPPVSPLSSSVNYTNQDSLGCRPGNLSFPDICVRLIHGQVNRVSHDELMQVAQGFRGRAGPSPRARSPLPRAKLFFFPSVFCVVIHTTSCLSSSPPVCLSVLQLSNYPAPDLWRSSMVSDERRATTCAWTGGGGGCW